MAQKRKGFILISVILSCMVLISTATAFAYFASGQAKRQVAAERNEEFRFVSEIALKQVLHQIASDQNGYDSPSEKIYSAPLNLKFGDYTVTTKITPMSNKIALQSIFNENGTKLRKQYQTAWDNIWNNMSNTALDYIDSDKLKVDTNEDEPDGNLNRIPSKLEELKKNPDIDDKMFTEISKYFTIYGTDQINLNTVTPEVLSVLDSNIDSKTAQSIVMSVREEPVKSVDSISKISALPPQAANNLKDILGVESSHFRLDMTVKHKNGQTRQYRIISTRSKKIICQS